MKVMTILGTRPEIIRLSRVMAKLDQAPSVKHVIVHTGQNYDYELNEVFFAELGLRQPDHFLKVDTTSLGTVYGETLIKSEAVLLSEQPDVVLILGDTNSSIASIIAKRMHIPVVHMEAGNRSFDWRVPEEVNRHIVDAIADINLVYTEHARRNLLAEGLAANTIYLTGSPMAEVISHNRDAIDASEVLVREGVEPGGYFVVSLHREENVDNVTTLANLMQALEELGRRHQLPVLVSLHPRTKKRLSQFGLEVDPGIVRFHPPYGFCDYVKLELDARCVISDSGTLSEESSLLGFPAVHPRRSMERPEGLDAASLVLSGTQPKAIIAAAEHVMSRDRSDFTVPSDYAVLDCSDRVLGILLSRPLLQVNEGP